MDRSRTNQLVLVGSLVATGLVVAALGVGGLVWAVRAKREPEATGGSTWSLSGPAATFTADEFMLAVGGNPATLAKYHGSRIRLTGGQVESIRPHYSGDMYVWFEESGLGVRPRKTSPRCFFKPADLAELKPGDVITVEGRLGVEGTVDLVDCKIIR